MAFLIILLPLAWSYSREVPVSMNPKIVLKSLPMGRSMLISNLALQSVEDCRRWFASVRFRGGCIEAITTRTLISGRILKSGVRSD